MDPHAVPTAPVTKMDVRRIAFNSLVNAGPGLVAIALMRNRLNAP